MKYGRTHINILELRSFFNYIRYRARNPHKYSSRFLTISDSQVAVSVATKGRSSSQRLDAVLLRLSALMIACDFRTVLAGHETELWGGLWGSGMLKAQRNE